MPIPDQIQAIVFDAYGTLFDVASIDRRLAYHFGKKAPEVAALWRRKQLEYTWLRTLMDRYRDFYHLTRDALVYTVEALGLSVDENIEADLMDHYYQLSVYEEVPDALRELGRRYRLAILSNANPEMLERGVGHNGIADLFEGIFSVDSIRKFKPDPEVYRLPAAGLGLKPEEIFFVSSNPWDVAGAKSAGLKVGWIMRKTGVLEQLEFRPDVRVMDLRGLV